MTKREKLFLLHGAQLGAVELCKALDLKMLHQFCLQLVSALHLKPEPTLFQVTQAEWMAELDRGGWRGESARLRASQ